MLVPAEWIAEWALGSGVLLIIARNGATVTAGAAQISLHQTRVKLRIVDFDYSL